MNKLVAVAVSGGRDSMALLHCTARTASALRIGVIALHVHHGLHPAADAWADLVADRCRRWAVNFAMQRLAGQPGPAESVEAWARRGRYLALAAMAHEAQADLVLLAHHRRDQAETFLLQALRGAGPAGLSAMPRQVLRNGIVWARPWLEMPATAIDAYLRRHRLPFADDPSNADPRYARSRLRTQCMPGLREAFGDAEAMLAAAAARSAEAQSLLSEVAAADLAAACDGAALRLLPWRAWSEARRRNALRAWLRERLGRGAPQSLVERLMRELPTTPARPNGHAQAPRCAGTAVGFMRLRRRRPASRAVHCYRHRWPAAASRWPCCATHNGASAVAVNASSALPGPRRAV